MEEVFKKGRNFNNGQINHNHALKKECDVISRHSINEHGKFSRETKDK